MLNYLKELVKIPAVSGRENKITDYIRGEIGGFFDEAYTDALGNLICRRRGSGKKLLFCAHTDEIGFIVTAADDKGYIRFAPVGGINFFAAAYSSVVFESGLRGVLVPEDGLKPEDYKAEHFYVDIGVKTKRDAERLVAVGDTFMLEPSYHRLRGGRLCGRPFDNRAGCAVLMAAAREAQSFSGDVTFVFSVQEEVGLRGAKTAAFGIAADIGIALDVTATGDVPESAPMAVSLGGGASIKIKDKSVICDAALVSAMKNIAAENGIRHQMEILTVGGTDTAALQLAGAGCRAGCISIPARYIHTGTEMLDTHDLDACLALVCALCKKGAEL